MGDGKQDKECQQDDATMSDIGIDGKDLDTLFPKKSLSDQLVPWFSKIDYLLSA